MGFGSSLVKKTSLVNKTSSVSNLATKVVSPVASTANALTKAAEQTASVVKPIADTILGAIGDTTMTTAKTASKGWHRSGASSFAADLHNMMLSLGTTAGRASTDLAIPIVQPIADPIIDTTVKVAEAGAGLVSKGIDETINGLENVAEVVAKPLQPVADSMTDLMAVDVKNIANAMTTALTNSDAVNVSGSAGGGEASSEATTTANKKKIRKVSGTATKTLNAPVMTSVGTTTTRTLGV